MLIVAHHCTNSGSESAHGFECGFHGRPDARQFSRELCISQLFEFPGTAPLIDHPRPGKTHPLNRPTAIQLK
jgi:hypothetical protein